MISAQGTRVVGLVLAMLAAPAVVEAGERQPPPGTLTDAAGNIYGVSNPAQLDGNWRGPLTSVVRMANATLGVSVAEHQGKAIRLKPPAQRQHCSQTLRGNKHNNLLDGSMSTCDETIMAYEGDDVLIGGTGKNILNGGAGADVITGGGDADTFVYERPGDSSLDDPDIITDFKTSTDIIDLTGIARTSGESLSFIGWNEFKGISGQVNYELMEYWECDKQQNCSDQYLTIVQVDLDGDGLADFCIDLSGRHFLRTKNFALGIAHQQS